MKKIFTHITLFACFFLSNILVIAQNSLAFGSYQDIVVDSKGNVFASHNRMLIKITPDEKAIVFAGKPGENAHKDGKGTEALFDGLHGITIDKADNIYAADYNCIRKITAEGIVSTIAGNERNSVIKDGDRNSASFQQVEHITTDNIGNIYVTDEGVIINTQQTRYNVIRKITPEGIVSTLKNKIDGSEIRLNAARGIACDKDNNILVSDLTSRCIKKVTQDGIVTIVAGKCDLQKYNPTYKEGDIQSATLVTPGDIAVSKNGEIYFSDSRLNRIVKIANSKVITVAGNSKIVLQVNIGGYSEGGYADGKAKMALFHEPLGIAFDAVGNLYVADFENKCIRKITPDGIVSTLCK